MTRRLVTVLDVRSGEGRLVALLLAHSFFLGIAVVLFETAASGLFLHRFPADSIPLAFIGAAVCVPLTGIVYGRLQRRISPGALWIGSLAFLLALQLALVALTRLTTAAWPVLLMMALTFVMAAVGALEFWGLAGRCLDLRQAKRLYGLIGSGEIAAGILGGIAVSLLLRVVGLVHVLLIAAASLGVCLAILARLLRTGPAHAVEDDDEEGGAGGVLNLVRAVARDRYILLIVGLYLFYNLSHDTLDYLHLVQIQARLGSSSEEVASFIGLLFSVRQVVVLVARSLLSGRLLARFGLGAGLVATPALVVTAGTGIILIALLGPGATALFWPVIGLKVVERIFWNSLGKPAVLVAYRPLTPKRRDRAQLTIETLIEPLSTGLTGVILLVLARILGGLSPEGRSIGFVLMMVLGGSAWLIMGRRLRAGYTDVVVTALRRGTLRSVVVRLDAPTIADLGRWLHGSKAADIVYLLGVLEESLDRARFTLALEGLLDHPDPDVRIDVLHRIERLNLRSFADRLSVALDGEPSPRVRAALLRALAALGETAVLERITPYLDDTDPLLRRSALVALLKYNGVSGVLTAGRRLLALLESNPTDRRIAAEVIGEVGVSAFYHPLRTLLVDADPDVRAAAIRAAGALAHPHLMPELIADLARPTLWKPASDALAGGGDAAVAGLSSALDWPDGDRATRARIVRVLGRIRRPEAIVTLRRHLGEPQGWLRSEVLAALCRVGWRPGEGEVAAVERRLHGEVAIAAAVNAALVDLGDGVATAFPLLVSSLEHDLLRASERVLSLLALLYDPDSMRQARIQLRSGSPERRNYALEVLDNLCARRHKALFLPLLEGHAPGPLRDKLEVRFPEPLLGRDRRLRALAEGTAPWVTEWMQRFAVRALDPGREGEMEQTIQKVMLLKSVEFFSSTDDDVLAELATALSEVRFRAGERIIERGKTDACMYILQSGEVRVHQDDRTLATLGERAVFGEFGALDPQPRNATITATRDSALLRIDHATLVDLMAEHIEVAHGIIRYLIRRYGRADGPGQGGVVQRIQS